MAVNVRKRQVDVGSPALNGGGPNGGQTPKVMPDYGGISSTQKAAEMYPQAQPSKVTADYDTAISQIGTEGATKNKYDYLRDLSAKDLLDKNVMLAISNEVAKKNLSTQLAAQGLANSGHASTALALTENAYNAGLRQNQVDYATALASIGQQELESEEEAQNLRAENIVNQISAMDSEQRIANYLAASGLTKGENGWTGEGYTKDQLKSINDAYADIVYQMTGVDVNDKSSSSLYEGKTAYTMDELENKHMSGTGSYLAEWGDELRHIRAGVSNGLYTDGQAFHVERGHGGSNRAGGVYIVYHNGKFYEISREEYETYTGKKAHIKEGKNIGE